jgi:hypothetical protein
MPISLPLFKGRAEFIARLRDQLQQATVDQTNSIVDKAMRGLEGVGNTRLAVEYAWQHLDDYSALLFVGAQTPEVLQQNIAALAGPPVLDLPEQNENDQEIRVKAALRWLEQSVLVPDHRQRRQSECRGARRKAPVLADNSELQSGYWKSIFLKPERGPGPILSPERVSRLAPQREAEVMQRLSDQIERLTSNRCMTRGILAAHRS